jgi:6-phosphofructokinase
VSAVLIPEEDFEVEKVSRYIMDCAVALKQAVIVMAEGARGIEKKNGKWLRWRAETREERDENFRRMQQAIRDALIQAGQTEYHVFGNQPQHFIRSVAPNSHDQVYCRRLADMVVDSCLGGYTNFMISSWLTEYVIVPLAFSAQGGLTDEGYKTFPTRGVFWRTVLGSTQQPDFLSDEVREAIKTGRVHDENKK